MVFGLFRDKNLELFAGELAKELSARLPPASVPDASLAEAKTQTRLAKTFRHVFLSIDGYCRDNNVGLLKKARLSKIFQDELAASGYGEEFVKEVTLAIAEHLTGK